MSQISPDTRKANLLVNETSPYLLQHAYNPVAWQPWNAQALAQARAGNKPIFLSVGYSACHWCHVMEHESFENVEIAQVLNEQFVCIKVDREERPDIDQIYMNVVQLMTGRGGWPMSVFLKPDLTPIFAGTYFPPTDHFGMPGFKRVIAEVARVFRENPPALEKQTQEIMQALRQAGSVRSPSGIALDEARLLKAADALTEYHDTRHGGFGGAPKFPQTMALTFLLHMHQRTQKKEYLDVVTHTLQKMGDGGIYDHLAGGFARYSVDDQWAVPHFEKMLYDNALLADLYVKVFQATGDEYFLAVARGTLDYALRDMTSKEGAFFSSEDADSEGEEGKFYVWDPQEVEQILGADDARIFCQRFDVNSAGNFEHGKTVLAIHESLKTLAETEKTTEKDISERLERARHKLFEARKKRIAPGKDEKILVSWNALMIRAFLRLHQATQESKYLDAATRSADYILDHMTTGANHERLLATAKDGRVKDLPAYLDDHVYFSAALLDLFEITANEQWLKSAALFTETVLERFADPAGGFYFTADDHEKLIDRPKVLYDASIPSGSALAIENLLRLNVWSDDQPYREFAQKHLMTLFPMAAERVMGMTQMLLAAERFIGPEEEIVLAGDPQQTEYKEARRLLGQSFRPRSTFLPAEENSQFSGAFAGLQGLLADKTAHGKPFRVYFCQNRTCQAPVEDLVSLAKVLLATQKSKGL